MNDELHAVISVRLFTDRKCFGPGIAELLHNVETHHSLRAAAKEMRERIHKALSERFRINFHNMTVTDRSWTVSLIRVKTERGLISSRSRGEDIATGMLYDLKKIPGIIGVTLVEKDLSSMVFSYRLFYNRQKLQEPLRESVSKISRKYKM